MVENCPVFENIGNTLERMRCVKGGNDSALESLSVSITGTCQLSMCHTSPWDPIGHCAKAVALKPAEKCLLDLEESVFKVLRH